MDYQAKNLYQDIKSIIDLIHKNQTNIRNEKIKSIFYSVKTVILALIMAIGLLGNALNLIVLGKSNMRKVMTFRFLFYLSAVDLIVLITGTTDLFLRHLFNFEIRTYSNVMCKLHTFLTYTVTHLSSNLLMTVSVHRAFDMVYINFSTCQKASIRKKSTKKSKASIYLTSIEMKDFRSKIDGQQTEVTQFVSTARSKKNSKKKPTQSSIS